MSIITFMCNKWRRIIRGGFMFIDSICPDCNKKKRLGFSSIQELLNDLQTDLEQNSNDSDLKLIINNINNYEKKDLIPSIQFPIQCNCGCDYDISDSKNWNEIKNYFSKK